MLGILFAVIAGPLLQFCMGCNFAGLQLAGSNFAAVEYIGTNFAGAVLRNASFRRATLVAANFQGADLQGAAFDAAECTACNFDGAKLDQATFSGVRMTAANFSGFASNVENAQLGELLKQCFACNFGKSSLAGRDLSGLPLVGVDFSQADLRGTKFNDAILCSYVINGTQRSIKCDTMKGALVDGANFENVQICSDASDRQTCAPIDAKSLQRYTGSLLNGAALP